MGPASAPYAESTPSTAFIDPLRDVWVHDPEVQPLGADAFVFDLGPLRLEVHGVHHRGGAVVGELDVFDGGIVDFGVAPIDGDGLLLGGLRLDVGSPASRQACAKHLAARIGIHGMDWLAVLDRFAHGIPGCRVVDAIDPRTEAIITVLDSVAPRAVEWLWRHRIPEGMLTILDGDPGLGKSMLTLDLAARVSTGQAMPGEYGTRKPRGVVILSAEDDPARTIRPRLEVARADLSRIAIVDIRESDGTLRSPTIAPDDLRAVEQAIAQVNAAVLIVDPLVAYLPDDVNANRDHDVRRSLSLLSDLAERTGAAILVVRHLRKGAAENPLYRGGGSIGIIGAARAGLLVARDPDDESGQRRILAVTKQNLAPEPPALAFTLEVPEGAEHPHLVWQGPTGHQAADLLRGPDPEASASALRDAEAFLRDVLADGPQPATTVRRMARDAGISDRTLDRARAALGVIARRTGGLGAAGRWEWAAKDAHRTPVPTSGVLSGALALLADDVLPAVEDGHPSSAGGDLRTPRGGLRTPRSTIERQPWLLACVGDLSDDDPQASAWLDAPLAEMPQ